MTNFFDTWHILTVTREGHILPPAKTACKDRMNIRTMGPGLYRICNITKAYVCFVEVRKAGRTKQARCDHDNCVEWGRLCKHIRKAVKHHVRLKRRALKKAHNTNPPQADAAFLEAIEGGQGQASRAA
jgi:hypothetical protein